MKEIGLQLDTLNWYSIATALICLIIILITPKVLPKVPGSLVGLIVSSVIATFFFSGQIPTIGIGLWRIPNSLPQFEMLDITWGRIERLIGPAFVIAALGAIESLLSAVVADGMTNSKHNSNGGLIGQGIANIITPFFGGIPATGAIARTATNISSRAVLPCVWSHSRNFRYATLLVLAPYASAIP